MRTEHWQGWLRAAAMIGLLPSAFWRLSFAEWRALTATSRADALSAEQLAALMDRFPDKTHG